MSVWIDFDYLSVGSKIAEDEITLVEKKAKVSKKLRQELSVSELH